METAQQDRGREVAPEGNRRSTAVAVVGVAATGSAEAHNPEAQMSSAPAIEEIFVPGDETIGAGMLAADTIREALLKRFPRAEYATLFEVRNAAGFSATRSCDCVAVSLWPSRGLHITGIEIKISRSDWLRELKQPAKAEAFAQFCDYWYVIAPKGLIKVDEVPLAWGLMEVTKRGIAIAKSATLTNNGDRIDRSFLATLLKRAQEQSATATEVTKARAEGVKDGMDRVEYKIKDGLRELERLRERVVEFEKASGVAIDNWRSGDIGEAVRMLVSARTEKLPSALKEAAQKLRAAANDMDTAHAVFTAINEQVAA